MLWLKRLSLVLCLACPALSATPTPQTFLTLNSLGDYVGGGIKQTFTTSDGTFSSFQGPTSQMTILFSSPSQNWSFIFTSPNGVPFTPGEYDNAQSGFLASPVQAGISISGDGRGCNQSSGRYLISELTFAADGSVASIALDFEQYCEQGKLPLYGSLRINSVFPASPQLAIASLTALKGNTGTNDATVLVSLSMPSSVPVTVQYSTQDYSALAGLDYVTTAGTLTFPPNTTLQPITVPILGDRRARGNQTFNVVLYLSSGPPISVTATSVQILDPNVPLNVLSLYGKPGCLLDNGFVILRNSIDNIFTPRISPGAGVVFDVKGPGTWSVQFADVNANPPVPGTYDRARNYGRKAFVSPYLNVTSPDSACEHSIGDFTVLQSDYTPDGQVLDFASDFWLYCDKRPPLHGSLRYNAPFQQLSVSNATIDPSGSTASFVVTLNPPTTTWVDVTFQTADSTALAGADYVSTSKVLRFGPGIDQKVVTVPLITSNGGTKSFWGTLTAPVNAPVWIQQASATF